MYVQQLYTACLSEAAYYLESNGEAAVIDPLRDIDTYLKIANERNATIKYIFETHFHADFVSGHIDLAHATGATIVFGPGTKTNYPVHVAADGEVIKLGNITLTALHTPGHTIESTCWLMKDEAGNNEAVFTGDTLFIGDVGRPDLSSGDLSSDELAAMLFDSLQNKIVPLEDSVLVYPAHGPGSACGKNIGPDTFSTIGDQKQHNYALQAKTKEEFVAAVTKGLADAPAYFSVNASINQKGYLPIHEVLADGMEAMTAEAFEAAMADEDTVVLDSRNATIFTQGFVPGAICIGLEGRFAEWAATLIPFDKKILVVAEPGTEKETVTRLARVGFDRMIGYLEGGFEAWRKSGRAIDLIIDVEADEVAMDLPHDDKMLILDVRTEAEFGSGHIVGSMLLPLTNFTDVAQIATVPEDANVYVLCGGGYRSVIAASIMKAQGLHSIRNIVDGWAAIEKEERIPTEKEKAVLN